MKKYVTNYKLEIASKAIYDQLAKYELVNIHDVIKLVSGDNLPKSKMISGTIPVYGGGGITENTHSTYNVDFKTIGIGRVGARCGCVFEITPNAWVTDNALFAKDIDPRFDLHFLIHYLNQVNLNKYANNALQPVISKKRISSVEVPLVPLEEQILIGQVFEEILNGEISEENELHFDLKIPLRFEMKWQALKSEISHQQTLLTQLKQAILQEAIQGKLTAEWRRQHPGVEPASVLLDRIRAEKERLIEEGKIKKQKPLPPITEEEKPFELPEGWVWCRLGELVLKLTDGTHHSPPNGPQGEYKYITAKNISTEGIRLDNITYINKETHQEIFNRCDPSIGDILYIKDGATTGITCINTLQEEFSLLSSVALLKLPHDEVYNKYLLYALRSPFYYRATRVDMSGVAITRVTLKKMGVALVPLPSYEEQICIADYVDSLMERCSNLELQINQSQNDASYLMQAVLQEAFSGTAKETVNAQ